MKKIKIITSIIILLFLLLQIMCTICMAQSLQIQTDNYKPGSPTDYDQVTNKVAPIVIFLRTIGVIVAIAGISIIGIKYMLGSTEQRAGYKKSLIPYVIGTIMIVGLVTVLSIIIELSKKVNEIV